MSKADEMFEELGYEKEVDISEDSIYYINNNKDITIEFDLNTKEIIINEYRHTGCILNIQELQAINEKCKELGWIESEV